MQELSEQQAIALVERINQKLHGVKLDIRGKNRNLGLRGTFPPKTGAGSNKPKQTRISLKMKGVTKEDIKQAEIVARQVELDLNTGEFDWRKFDLWADDGAEQKTIKSWIEEFERFWWSTHDLNPSAENNWYTCYQLTLNKLPQDGLLSKEIVREWVESNSRPQTSRRSHYCRAGKALCKFAGIEIDLSDHDQGISKVINPRNIPTDEELLSIRAGIEDHGWRYLFGLQIAYGLRNHELLLIDYSNFPRLRVTRGKTGPRTVTPILPQWAEDWKLGNPLYPKKLQFRETDPLDKLGLKITVGYKRRGLPNPYDVRHAFARRCIEQELEPSLGAKLMGHSPHVHTQIYRAWVSEETYLNTIERKLRGE